VAKQLDQFSVSNVSGHILSNDNNNNRNLVSQAIEFDIGEISANSANHSLVEPVLMFHPIEFTQWNQWWQNRRIFAVVNDIGTS
jgi:hypothetical protein